MVPIPGCAAELAQPTLLPEMKKQVATACRNDSGPRNFNNGDPGCDPRQARGKLSTAHGAIASKAVFEGYRERGGVSTHLDLRYRDPLPRQRVTPAPCHTVAKKCQCFFRKNAGKNNGGAVCVSPKAVGRSSARRLRAGYALRTICLPAAHGNCFNTASGFLILFSFLPTFFSP